MQELLAIGSEGARLELRAEWWRSPGTPYLNVDYVCDAFPFAGSFADALLVEDLQGWIDALAGFEAPGVLTLGGDRAAKTLLMIDRMEREPHLWAVEVEVLRSGDDPWPAIRYLIDSERAAIRRALDPRRGGPARRMAPRRASQRGRPQRLRAAASLARGRVACRRMAANEKPQVEVPADQAPSYQLEVEDLTLGDGDEAAPGLAVEVHYVGVSWSNGEQFDASWDRGQTFKFGLGKGQVIEGWDQGVAGMRVGGRRRITVPPMLGYGKRGAGGVIGPDETLVFIVDLMGVGAIS